MQYDWHMIKLSFKRHRFPPEVIRHSVWLYARFTLSFRDIEDLLAEPRPPAYPLRADSLTNPSFGRLLDNSGSRDTYAIAGP